MQAAFGALLCACFPAVWLSTLPVAMPLHNLNNQPLPQAFCGEHNFTMCVQIALKRCNEDGVKIAACVESHCHSCLSQLADGRNQLAGAIRGARGRNSRATSSA